MDDESRAIDKCNPTISEGKSTDVNGAPEEMSGEEKD